MITDGQMPFEARLVPPVQHHWRAERLPGATMIICALVLSDKEAPVVELAHTITDAQLREYHDPKWLVRNAIEGLQRNAGRPELTGAVSVNLESRPQVVRIDGVIPYESLGKEDLPVFDMRHLRG